MNKLWYEEITSDVLCWVTSFTSAGTMVDVIKAYHPYREYPFEGIHEFWKYARPVTSEEFDQFKKGK